MSRGNIIRDPFRLVRRCFRILDAIMPSVRSRNGCARFCPSAAACRFSSSPFALPCRSARSLCLPGPARPFAGIAGAFQRSTRRDVRAGCSMTPLDRLLDFFARFVPDPPAAKPRRPRRAGARLHLFRLGFDLQRPAFRAAVVPAAAAVGAAQPARRDRPVHLALRRKPEWPTLLEIRNAGIVGTMLVALSSGTIALGISLVSSGSAAVMVATVPLFATVIAAVAGRPVTKGEWSAVALGMVGIVVLNSAARPRRIRRSARSACWPAPCSGRVAHISRRGSSCRPTCSCPRRCRSASAA